MRGEGVTMSSQSRLPPSGSRTNSHFLVIHFERAVQLLVGVLRRCGPGSAFSQLFFQVSPLQQVSDSLRQAAASVLHAVGEPSVLPHQSLHSGPTFLVVVNILESTISGSQTAALLTPWCGAEFLHSSNVRTPCLL